MPLTLDDPETERLARELAERTGETVQVATRRALEDRLRTVPQTDLYAGLTQEQAERLARMQAISAKFAELPVRDRGQTEDEKARTLAVMREISQKFAELPVLDPRSPDEILEWDENGLPI